MATGSDCGALVMPAQIDIVDQLVKEAVAKGAKLFTLHTDEPTRFESALEVLNTGYAVGGEAEISERLPLIIDRLV